MQDSPTIAPVAVVMAKAPVPGRVKTRIAAAIGTVAAARIAEAMLSCTLSRLSLIGWRVVLAISPDEALSFWDPPAVTAVIPQGSGSLGERMARIWSTFTHDRVCFLGADSPDLPLESLAAVPRMLDRHVAAVGPTEDGGYWCLAGRQALPELLAGIDWGTPSVYDQTVARAAEHGLSLGVLPRWSDVDTLDDLERLRTRIGRLDRPPVSIDPEVDGERPTGEAAVASLEALRQLDAVLVAEGVAGRGDI